MKDKKIKICQHVILNKGDTSEIDCASIPCTECPLDNNFNSDAPLPCIRLSPEEIVETAKNYLIKKKVYSLDVAKKDSLTKNELNTEEIKIGDIVFVDLVRTKVYLQINKIFEIKQSVSNEDIGVWYAGINLDERSLVIKEEIFKHDSIINVYRQIK